MSKAPGRGPCSIGLLRVGAWITAAMLLDWAAVANAQSLGAGGDCSCRPGGAMSAFSPTPSQTARGTYFAPAGDGTARSSGPEGCDCSQGTVWLDPLPSDCQRPPQRVQCRFHPAAVSHQQRLVQAIVGTQRRNRVRRTLRIQPHLVKESPGRHFREHETECRHSDQQQNRAHKPAPDITHADAPVSAARFDADAFAEASSFLVAAWLGLEVICWAGPISTILPPT